MGTGLHSGFHYAGKLTLNLGIRFDRYGGLTKDSAAEPRFGIFIPLSVPQF